MPEITLDFKAGDTLAEVAAATRLRIHELSGQGHRILSVSHAADVSGDEPKWSILVLYEKD